MMKSTRVEADFRVPPSLRTDDDAAAVAMLQGYYQPAIGARHSYDGALFDTWDSTGTRHATRNEFTADDLLAVTFLSVRFSAAAAHSVLESKGRTLSERLERVGEDVDLAEVEEPIDAHWAPWKLYDELRSIKGIGLTKATKLMARKRPRLIPIYDSVVAKVTNTVDQQWVPLREALRQNPSTSMERLQGLHERAGLDPRVSALRVLDVIAWMDGDPRRREPALRRAGLKTPTT
jgi:hypothetical protein